MAEIGSGGGRRRRNGLRTIPVAVASAIAAVIRVGPEPERRTPGRTASAGSETSGASRTGRRDRSRHGDDADYVVAPGDTAAGIAERFGLRIADLLARNGLSWSSAVHPGQRLDLGAPSTSPGAQPGCDEIRRHLVVDGDTAASVAARYGLPVREVLAANGLGPTSALFPGEQLSLPGAVDPLADSDTAAGAGAA
nr:LysM peptidoglycan-binding domain-containing protein [Agromyces seonyuensis]